ncbi:hypothetical protein V8E54_002262 [Elaphomyces granulatus]
MTNVSGIGVTLLAGIHHPAFYAGLFSAVTAAPVVAPAPVMAAPTPVLHAATSPPVLSAVPLSPAPLLYAENVGADRAEAEEAAQPTASPPSSPLSTLSSVSLSSPDPPPSVSPVLVNSAATAKPTLPWISEGNWDDLAMRQIVRKMGHKGYCRSCKKSRYPRRNCSKNRKIYDYFNLFDCEK